MKIDTYQSVWDAIADNPEEAVNLKIRSQLMDILATYIHSEGITQKEAAIRFDIPRSRVSELVNDRISKFTIDKLVKMAARVGLNPLNIDPELSRYLSDRLFKIWFRPERLPKAGRDTYVATITMKRQGKSGFQYIDKSAPEILDVSGF